MTPRVHSIKKRVQDIHAVALRRQRAGEEAPRIVEGISDGMDGLLRSLFTEDLLVVGNHVALVAVGGYGRRELCPFSDVDLLFLCDDLDKSKEHVGRVVQTLWDSGFQLGHSVRSPDECLRFMRDDDVTAATLLESRFLIGSESLMRRFQERALNRYTKQQGERFASRKLGVLRRSIEGLGHTIFVTEPHIKEGMCCMRDVQHILWIERLRRRAISFDDIAHHGGFAFEEIRKLADAYAFFLRVRCELHFMHGIRQDILESEAQPAIATRLGYQDDADGRAVEKLMGDYYLHARNVLSFARYYIETKSRGTRFLSKLRHRVMSSRVNRFLSLYDGRLYLAVEPLETGEELAAKILHVFLVARERNADLSESLCEWIRRKLIEVPIDFTRSATVDAAFLALLQDEGHGGQVGRVLTRMHQTGVLGRILPEFQALDCLVTFDGHHQFTVDEHTLRALRELDRIESDENYPLPVFRRVLEGVQNRLPLRLALLLHDIGKSSKGSHDVKGTEAAMVICERLGLDEKTAETVEFLIYRHLAMFQFSDRMDFAEEGVIARYARLVRDCENLDMLYLLTYIDIKSVGPGTWTDWKGAQLHELYQRTRIFLETGGQPVEDFAETLATSGVDPEVQGRIVEHSELVDHPAYRIDNIPERMLVHVEMVRAFLETGSTQVHDDEMVGCHEVTFCERDRVHLFADLAGLLLSEGLNVLGARIYSRRDGIAIDCFQVVIADELRVGIEKRVENLRGKLARIERGEVDVTGILSQREQRFRYAREKKALFPPRVKFHDDHSRTATAIEVDAGDRPGLLYDLATAIADLGLDLRTAKISTMINRARDVFYVVESDGGKVVDSKRRREITERLIEAAEAEDQGAESATVIAF